MSNQQNIKNGGGGAVAGFGSLVAVLVYLIPRPAYAQVTGWLTNSFESMFRDVAGAVLEGMSYLVSITSSVLDAVIKHSIVQMAENIDNIDAIREVWVIIRDFGNLIFIFITVYAAIAIILDLSNSNPKKLLARVLVVALLVNFSFFFSRVVIDGSNVIALQFNNAVQVVDENDNVQPGQSASISEVFANAVQLPSLYDPDVLEEAADDTSNGEIDSSKLALIMIGGSVFLLVTAFIFLAAAFLLLIRFAILILLMILSPLAFFAYVSPNTKEYAEQWWDELINQSLFAPAFFALFYIVGKIINSDGFQNMLASGGSLGSALADPSSGVGILINFGLVTILMIAALILAKQMGAYGADKATSIGKNLSGWIGGAVAGGAAGTAAYAGRRGIGSQGAKIRDSKWLKNKASDEDAWGITRWGAKTALKGGQKTAQSSFDVRNTGMVDNASDVGQHEGGYDDYLDRKEQKLEDEKELIESMSPEEERRAEAAKNKKDNLQDQKSDIGDDRGQIKQKIDTLRSKRKDYIEAESKEAKDAVAKQIQAITDNLEDDLETLDEDDIPDELEQALDPADDGIDFADAETALEELDDKLDDEESQVEGDIKRMTRIAEKGKQRGEEFVEAKAKQKGVWDQIDDKYIGLKRSIARGIGRDVPDEPVDSEKSSTTKVNRMFAASNLDSIENRFEADLKEDVDPKRDKRVSNALGVDTDEDIGGGPYGTSSESSDSGSGTPSSSAGPVDTAESTDADSSGETDSRDSSDSSPSEEDGILDGFPDVPETYRNELEQAYERAERALSDMAPDEMNAYLKTEESSPLVRNVDRSGDTTNITYQDNPGEFQEAETSSAEELGQRRTQETSNLEDIDDEPSTGTGS